LVSGDLGKDNFFTKAFDNQEKIDDQKLGAGNKGHNMGNLSSLEMREEIAQNLDKVKHNIEDSHIYGSNFKPT